MRLGENPSALHLEALGVHVLLWDSLVTLGGCLHLDGLVQRVSSSGGRCLSLAPIMVIVWGSPRQILPRTENRTELTENQTELTENRNFGYLFGSQFLGTELCSVKSVPPLG